MSADLSLISGKIVDGMDNIRNFNGQYGDKG